MKKLLIVVDYQNDFIDGTLGFDESKKIGSGILKRVKYYVKNKDDIIFTMDSHDNNYLKTVEGKWLPIKHSIINSSGWQIHKSLLPYLKYGTVITKNTFGAKELFNYFKKYEYQLIELIGIVSNMCVLANAIIAKSCLPNAQIVVNKKLIASPNKKLHEATLNILNGLHIKII